MFTAGLFYETSLVQCWLHMKTRRWYIYAVFIAGQSCAFEPRPVAILGCGRQLACVANKHQHADDIPKLHELLLLADIDQELCQIEPLSGSGFCNALYKVQCGTSKMVGKLFSSIAKQRMKSNGSRVDWMASKRRLGPHLFASTNDGILMQWLEGDGLTETTVHTSAGWIETVAPLLDEFHSIETPPRPPHMLWETMQVMMDMTTKGTPGFSAIREHVLRQRELIEPLNLPVVLGHGDLKPANVVGHHFIDFEVSGMHYRGFDVAKLFRTDRAPTQVSEDNMNAFIKCYLRSSVHYIDDDYKNEMELLKMETKLMAPLTWLEAAVFFVCSTSVDPEGADRWNRLASDRLKSYDASVVGLERCTDEYKHRRI